MHSCRKTWIWHTGSSKKMVDDLFNQFKQQLIKKINENVKNGEQATDMLMVAKYFERIGDHATNIAEWVIYSITGQHEN